jgi:hypothetical protein
MAEWEIWVAEEWISEREDLQHLAAAQPPPVSMIRLLKSPLLPQKELPQRLKRRYR